MSLVDVVDDVLDQLESTPNLRFTLDGQLATVDDYLEIRPEAEERIRRLVHEGRLGLGPWQTLMDEFLVDGETTLRNLETGLRRAEEFGPVMRADSPNLICGNWAPGRWGWQREQSGL